MSKSRKRGAIKKSYAQLQQYKASISASSYSPSGTVSSQSDLLVGSDEMCDNTCSEELYGKEKIKKTPLRYRFIDWIKANLFAAIITAIVIGVATTVITHRTKIAVMTQRLDYIEKRLDSLEEESIQKDNLSVQLKLIQEELSNDKNLSINDINWKIKEIEDRLGRLENIENKEE